MAHIKMRRKKKVSKQKNRIYCNPDICPYCLYIGEGDSLCEELNEIVLADWEPTEYFMGQECPYINKDKNI